MPVFQDIKNGFCPAVPDSRRPVTPQHRSRANRALENQQQQRETAEDEIMVDRPSSELAMASSTQTNSREELIRRIKGGESPTWVPNRSLEEYFAANGDSPLQRLEERKGKASPLLPSLEFERSPEQEAPSYRSCGSPISIERPRSALHSGDFHDSSPSPQWAPEQLVQSPFPAALNQSFQEPGWVNSNVDVVNSSAFADAGFGHRQRLGTPLGRSRAPSLGSIPYSYVLKAPTSPLVIQANNPDLDFSVKDEHMDICASPDKASRRRTLPPETFRNFPSSPYSHYQRPAMSMRSLQLASPPQGVDINRPRRPSQSAESPNLHHASMVGSFEESILRGRMSINPSKPLDFTAEIGVLGKGNCKPQLRCPPHVTVPFPAVFYKYSGSASGSNITDDSPSPYVGFIDLENSLPSEAKVPARKVKKKQQQHVLRKCPCHPPEESLANTCEPMSLSPRGEARAREKRSRRSQSPQSPPGGCYRIPQQGQLQIIIKNPNKTAVKLFLVPYDLEGMEPGTKTFIRQRSYSTGPAVDIPQLTPPDTSAYSPKDKPVLRYLIHINICCPSRGRFYLYSGIRAVFANRVPDGKEKLRNELQCPEPRFSAYKLSKESARLATEKAQQHRRRSSGIRLGVRDQTNHSPFNTQLSPSSLYPQTSDFSIPVKPIHPGKVFCSSSFIPSSKWPISPSGGSLDILDGISGVSTSPRSETRTFNNPDLSIEQDITSRQPSRDALSGPYFSSQSLQDNQNQRPSPSSRFSTTESLLSLKLRDFNEFSPPPSPSQNL